MLKKRIFWECLLIIGLIPYVILFIYGINSSIYKLLVSDFEINYNIFEKNYLVYIIGLIIVILSIINLKDLLIRFI